MHCFKKLTLACLMATFSFSSLMIANKKEELKEQIKDDEAKSNLLAGFGIMVGGVAAATWANQNSEFLQNTGLGVGLGALAICYGLSLITPENARTLIQMGTAAPFLAMLGTAIHTDAVSGPNGVIAKYGAFGLDKLARTTDGRKSTAFASLVTIASYNAVKPKLDKFVRMVGSKILGSRKHSENSAT